MRQSRCWRRCTSACPLPWAGGPLRCFPSARAPMGRSCGKTGVPFTAIQRGSRARDGGTKKITRPLGDLLSRVVPGFAEQRVMTGAAGLEHIMWQTLVSSSTLTEDQYRSMAAHQLLRKVLAAAKIPVDIDPGLLPVITQFAADERQRQGATLDGAHMVTQIRNRLVYPTGDQERVYRRDGLVAEAWLLTRHYLVLLILHSLGYRGLYRDLRRTSGWAADCKNVPWVGQ